MNTEEITAKVKDIVGSQVGCAAAVLESSTNINDDRALAIDSLDFIEIVMAVEAEFNIEIIDEDAAQIRTLGDMVAYIETHQ